MANNYARQKSMSKNSCKLIYQIIRIILQPLIAEIIHEWLTTLLKTAQTLTIHLITTTHKKLSINSTILLGRPLSQDNKIKAAPNKTYRASKTVHTVK